LIVSAQAQSTPVVVVPCELVGTFTIVVVSGITSNGTCYGTQTITSSGISNQRSSDSASDCPIIDFSSTVFSVQSTTSGGLDIDNVCLNITSGTGYTVGQLICITFTASDTGNDAYMFHDMSQQGTFPGFPAQGNYNEFALQATAGSTSQCTGGENGQINANDICLGFYDIPTKEFKCIAGYYERLALPVVIPSNGFPTFRAKGRLNECSNTRIYAFLNIPLPVQPIMGLPGESWWAKYGSIVLGVTITMFIILLICIYAISRLIRYRKKYHEEKAEAEVLREEAQDLDEKHGGLGVYDEEVEMIPNPLVVQMQELQAKLEQTNNDLKTQEEMDETSMAQLDKERQRILEEIKRVKDAIAQQKKTEASRVAETPGTTTGPTTKQPVQSEREEFTQTTAPPKRKNRDI